jgi:1-phosphatidylinositol-3-phosphate 5-kinase
MSLATTGTKDTDEDMKGLAASVMKEKDRKISRKELQHRCPAKQGEHELRLVHGETEVTIRVTGWDKPGQDVGDDAPLHIWSSCIVCGIECGKSIVSDGTWCVALFSFDQ